ncbi:glucose dehydrogenase [Nitrosomonas sp. JL21]|uniref:PQQ-dependent sugar dehydrogenase n=1 Tax=Nitrosomonas sp. JL21 TaxID=153949 RepID=UPI0013718229|nr:PQQ-dependent sugar dehydrogenase [Nitrosomonas sp. JL21]MBL8497964.1 PQQ-dependent sugar dehydrogenase [Nitrosomonas sp.]MCC7091531.1 PQQ-dependent sugar dehydrogenase [Nitrosomonas sp.]MXS78305.1 glucose dehydrogenase [Nitrosomonas sp. JL21]
MAYMLLILILLVSSNSSWAAGWPEPNVIQVINGLENPVHITHANDGRGRLFITEQPGRIRILSNGVLQPAPFLDISDRISCCGERGLLSIAFPPNFSTKGYFYVNYTNGVGNTVVSRFSVSSAGDIADPASESVILTMDQPFANHNGGQIAFGADGMLYIGMGDGGGGGDPLGSGQDLSSLLGKLLRIDVESGVSPYAIPANNPFASVDNVRPEIWASGLRNPWRFSFDRDTGDLYIADVGQNQYEEINFQPAASPGGENYGWNILEGNHCYQQASCNTSGLILPILEYDHSSGDRSITGGHVYRGGVFPRMRGIYLFADFASGRLAGLRPSATGFDAALLADTDFTISSFGEDEHGEMYLADYNGAIYRIEDAVRSSELSFNGILASYRPGNPLQVTVVETSSTRTVTYDLWVGIGMPDGQLFYLTGSANEPLSAVPQPFKRRISPNDKTHNVLNLTLPETLPTGNYRIYALYHEADSSALELTSSLRSNIAESVIMVGN